MTDSLRTFTALLDDAAVFSPGNLPLAEAVTAYCGHRRSAYAGLVGPLVLPAAALGGLVPEAHPGEAGLAGMLTGAVARGLAFKCTAGLHHAVRHTDGELEQHGFLNVLLATGAALRGAPPEELAGPLARRDAVAVAGQAAGLGDERLAAARASFSSFGTCSVAGPRDDLIRLGLLPAATAA